MLDNPPPIEDAAPPAAAPSTNERKPSHPPPAAVPTQHGPLGIRFDFNAGCRVMLPTAEAEQDDWRVQLSDLDTGNVLFEIALRGGSVNSAKRYFVRARIEVWQGERQVLLHDYDARGRNVHIQFPLGTLGDTLGWLPYAARFHQLHGCRLTCVMAERLIPLFAPVYPDIDFVTHDAAAPQDAYATYNLGLFFSDDSLVLQPCDFRLVGLHRTAGYILGVDPTEQPPLVAGGEGPRPIAEPYVCISVQSTTQCKYWNNPSGWTEVVRAVRAAGFRVICIDQRPVHGTGLVWNHLPHGCEDRTGDLPLTERVDLLRHAAFFIGLSSGLSWLAWAAGVPVVMISGFTHPTNEFETPYRVINYHACNSCWNDVRVKFDHGDFLWCPRHASTPRQFECSRLITADQVIQTIRRVPAFARSVSTGMSQDQART